MPSSAAFVRPPRAVALALLAALLGPAGASAQRADSAAYVVRLGVDTTAVERFIRSGDRIDAVSVTRSPRTSVRRLTVWLAEDGTVARYASGAAEGAMTEQVAVGGAIPLVGGFYVPWEIALLRARRAGGEAPSVTVLAGGQPLPIAMRRRAADEWAFSTQFDQPVVARVDPAGRMVSFAIAGGGATVERVRWIDLDLLARDFAARDAAGRGMGALSPRDSVVAHVGGADIVIDYSRPSLRGRPLEVLVPADQVWRMGANDAATLRSARPLRLGGLHLTPGSYSLFARPHRDGWTLIVNAQTGMSGQDRDPARDVGTVEMTTRRLPEHVERFTIAVEPLGSGGVLRLRWGRTEAAVPFDIDRP